MGWPLPDGEMLIVDETGRPVTQGKTGEIVIHSRFVSPGYWKDPILTAQKFRPDAQEESFFYYYSGDLGRTGPDGQIYFVGRVDSQVKIRGQRVELGEIESALLALEEIVEAVAGLVGNDDEPQNQYLAAWIVYRGKAATPTVAHLRQKLTEQLPLHAIPSRFYFLDRMPLNRNGKIDRLALSTLAQGWPVLSEAFVPPQTPVESSVQAIWSKVLNLDEIGIHDPFLELGGNSLQAMRIAAQVQEEFGVEIPLAELFAAPTVAEMALTVTTYLVIQSDSDETFR